MVVKTPHYNTRNESELLNLQGLFEPVVHQETLNSVALESTFVQVAREFLKHTGPLVPDHMGVDTTIEMLRGFSGQKGSGVLDSRFYQDLQALVDQTIQVHRPKFMGHMTSSLPFYVPALMSLLGSLNQNLVKIETSGGFSAVEKKVVSILHQCIYGLGQELYDAQLEDGSSALGVFCSGGTLGNLTAFWAFRNMYRQRANAVSVDRLRIYVSELGHYSIRKSIDVLGFDQDQIVSLPSAWFQGQVSRLAEKIRHDQTQGLIPFVIVGVAGSTETGSVDQLDSLADLALEFECFFHVDAAWGGAFCVAGNLPSLFSGIERADAVVIDAHKQLYVPIGCGVVLFKDQSVAQAIQFKANYIIREGSFDLGQFTLEGSRPALSFVLYTHLRVIGLSGYRLLFQSLLALTQQLSEYIQASIDFELTSTPQLNILTYRYMPSKFCSGGMCSISSTQDIVALDTLTVLVHKKQRANASSFVSRTRLWVTSNNSHADVFRVVLANPLTTLNDCISMLDEQRQLVNTDPELQELVKPR